jgi:hypothetical protein
MFSLKQNNTQGTAGCISNLSRSCYYFNYSTLSFHNFQITRKINKNAGISNVKEVIVKIIFKHATHKSIAGIIKKLFY